jgi:hypothetical protein
MKSPVIHGTAPNNGMHPTAKSVTFMRETSRNSQVRRGG